MHKRKIVAIAALALTLTGCGKWYGEGTVLEKEYQPGYTYYISCGKSSMCPAYQPECYWMKVRAKDGEHDGCIRPKLWEDHEIGDHIKITEDGN